MRANRVPKRVQVELLEQYRGLVIKMAVMHWRRLPPSVRFWVDVEDLMEECYEYILRRAVREYDGTRAGMTTFLWTGLDNLLKNYAQSYWCQKRAALMVPLEEAGQLMRRERTPELLAAEEVVYKIYRVASVPLQKQMQCWFGLGKRKMRWGQQFQKSRKEFLQLAREHRLQYDDCLELVKAGFVIQAHENR